MEALKQRWPRALLPLLHESGDAGKSFFPSAAFLSQGSFLSRERHNGYSAQKSSEDL